MFLMITILIVNIHPLLQYTVHTLVLTLLHIFHTPPVNASPFSFLLVTTTPRMCMHKCAYSMPCCTLACANNSSRCMKAASCRARAWGLSWATASSGASSGSKSVSGFPTSPKSVSSLSAHQGSGLRIRRHVGNAKIKTVFFLRNRFFSPGPYDLSIKNANFVLRFLRAFSIQNLDMALYAIAN